MSDDNQNLQVEREKVKLDRYKAQREYDNQASKANLEREKLELERNSQASQANLEREKLELERYKSRHDYKKFVLGSVFIALAIAAIPPSFQLATAALEYVKSNADRQAKQQAFRDDYIKEFITNALNQDIELRIRFAQYFARVSTEPFREDWIAYLNDLRGVRNEIRMQIDKMEAEWRLKTQAQQREEADIERLERNLAWAYKEVGYVERNRSAAGNPRAPEPGRQQTRPLDDDFFRGVERSAAKLSVGGGTIESFSDLKDLITSLPSESTMSGHIPPITRDADSSRVASSVKPSLLPNQGLPLDIPWRRPNAILFALRPR